MKHVTMAVMVAALLTVSTASAQSENCCKGDSTEKCEQGKMPRQRKAVTPELRTESMAIRLGLSDKQKAEVLALNREYDGMFGRPMMGRRHGLHYKVAAGSQLTEEQKAQIRQKRQEMREKRDQYNEKLKKILSSEQWEKLQMNRKPRQ